MASKSLVLLAIILAMNILTILAATPNPSGVSVETKSNEAILIELLATKEQSDVVRFAIANFPAHGQLFQAPSGWEFGQPLNVTNPSIDWTATTTTTARTKVWYQPNGDFPNVIETFTFKVDDSNEVNSATADVSISVYQSCPNLYQSESQWGQISGAPTPTVNIQYNQATQDFTFDVSAAYARGATWVIDFSEFNINTDRVGLATVCENRLDASFTGQFSTFWNSAPVANFASALGGSTYLSYPAANIWSLAASGCDKVNYTTTRSFSELLNCKDRLGASAITATKQNGTPFTDYTGTLYVQLVTPVDRTDQATKYQKIQWAYPFNFRFNMITNVLTTAESVEDVDVSIVSLTLNNDGKMVLRLKTEIATDHLTAPVAPTTPHALTITQDASTTVNVVQEWEYTSTQVSNTNYDGQYRFEWSFSNGGKAVAIINIQMKAQTNVNGQFSLNTKLATFKDSAFATASPGPFGSGARVYVKDSLDADSTDSKNFVLSVTNAWLCYSDNADFVPTYNPAANRYGCSVPIPGVLDNNNIVQLINTNLPVTTGVQQYFSVQLHNFADTYVTGFSFLAQPLSLQPRVYYIHAETLITQSNGQKRGSVMITRANQQSGTGNAVNSVYLEGGQLPGAEQTQDAEAAAGVLSVATPLVALFTVVLFMM